MKMIITMNSPGTHSFLTTNHNRKIIIMIKDINNNNDIDEDDYNNKQSRCPLSLIHKPQPQNLPTTRRTSAHRPWDESTEDSPRAVARSRTRQGWSPRSSRHRGRSVSLFRWWGPRDRRSAARDTFWERGESMLFLRVWVLGLQKDSGLSVDGMYGFLLCTSCAFKGF